MSEQVIYGLHAVTALLKRSNRAIKKLLLNNDRHDVRIQTLFDLALQRQIPIEKLTAEQMNQRFTQFTHQGVVAYVGDLPTYHESDLPSLLQTSKKPPLLLILDGITDPHNLGACLRTADATGVDFVILPKDKSVSLTPAVSKVACGAAETIPLVRVTNLVRAMELLKQEGIWIYGAAGEAKQTIYTLDFKAPIALVFGAEGSGMRRLTREHCDGLFALPMVGSVESLNISVAAGASLYEVLRQRS
ncbi:tRNA/rRNA methyltransferase [Legionella beliardensis]|uniref:23S rRNA (guanosine-2'-O-)-methyltransferase RlmB n=1 Tax=Legionella beliardensis TaxID=91822 RepID=A0A378I640_9GAMM|nr:23S rRNA (guanosine(2251)-2'-O)-methyltransferase RlmB [Legionella beliardensis]STX30121.1 tRNA/rRNA methyltransferase [Legionella beliardensis]